MAVKKRAGRKKVDPSEALKKYESVFDEIGRFLSVIDSSESELKEAESKAADAKAALDKARSRVQEIRDLRDGAKHGLYRYLAPADGREVLPLFDRMEPADEEVHGVNSDQWRKEPIAALKLSLPAQIALTEGDIMLVGQLQDRVLNDPDKWWEKVSGLTHGMAAAITDRLNDFIYERTDP
ncbi:hypothetical protein [Crateriforma conspicua]|uniref:Uncharacterized protein n=1 Tax=Crateriforma conspicua TaxID=2527996 RepID=A0A5C6FVM7_9PLAN|nr:hypothetical protein [Crateriforma conspicua]TWU66471.1 hypothetical protein V7x_20370 [Crateriforma conspicua]